MSKFWRIFGFSVLGIAAAIYVCFLFVLPNAIDLNQFKPMVKDIVKEQAKLDIDFENAKVITTPLLGVGAKIDNIKINLPDGSLLFSAESLKARVALPSIFLLTAKVSCFEVEKPFVNLEIADDNIDYKVVKLVENILNENKEKTLGEEVAEEGNWFNPAWIRIKVPCVKLKNYKVLITDPKTKHYLDLHGDELKAAYLNGKKAKVKTAAELFSDQNKNLTLNIDVNTFIPKSEPKLDSEDDPAERIDIPFINPVTTYRNYDLKANIDTKLRVRGKSGDITSFGYINVDNIALKVSQLQLPESYMHIKTFGHTVDLDTNIYPAEKQNIQLFGKASYSKHPWIDMNIKTAEIKFNDMLILSKAFLDSLRIKNELGQFKADGSLIADCYIKTNFKKLKSNGMVKIQNGGLAIRNLGQVISKANINVILDDNILDIKDSSLFVNNSKVNVDGCINKKSVADITVKTEKLPLPVLFNAFAPKEIRNAYNFRSGDTSVDLNIKGKLKEAVASVKFGLKNLNLSDRKNTFNLQNQNLAADFACNKKSLIGNIVNDGLAFRLVQTGSVVSIPKFETNISDKNITIKENSLLFNDKSEIKYSGSILNYEKLNNINFGAQGSVDTNDLVKLIGREFKPFIHSQGSIPVKLTFDGNKKKQTLFAQANSDKDNFITPVDLTELGNKTTTLQAVVDSKPGRIKSKKTGLFIKTITTDEKGKETVNLDSVVDLDGTIAGNRINLLKVTRPNILTGKIYAFPKSSFVVDKAKFYIFGQTSSPIIRGTHTLRDISIPELLTSVENVSLFFRGREVDFSADNVKLNGSDITAKGTLDLNPADVLNISGLNVSSRYINLEKLLKVVELANKYVPGGKSGGKSGGSAQAQSADIPVAVNSGSIDMRRIITGNIEVLNTTSRMTLLRNILALRNLRTSIFNGSVNGNIDVDLIKTLVRVDLNGNNINVAKAMLDAAGMKDMLSGTAEFKAELSIDGAAKTVEEQMKGLEGDVDFHVVKGQFGPFGKIENLIIAENIRESQFFQTALGGIINSLTSIDTTHFSELNGHLTFNEGICHIDPITSLGNTLTLHVFGDFDLVRNYADMKVRAKMSSIISKVLGPLNAINPINLMNSAASLNVVTAKAFSLFCEVVPADEIATLPSFENEYIDSGAAKFQLGVRGDAAKPLTLVKSFKWIASKAEFDQAEEYVNSLPDDVDASAATIEEAQALEAEKKTVKYKIKHIFIKDKK